MPAPSYSFTVKARVLRLLGDELIRDPGLAVFELVKNAYDADATICHVSMEDLNNASMAKIVVEDNGSGMSADLIRDVWLVIGTDFRAVQRAERKRTHLGRFPQGNKGLGRLAVHKLGQDISIITRKPNHDEVVLSLDWDKLEKVSDLAQTAVKVTTRPPLHFKGKRHGTRIEVRGLRDVWDRAKCRKLQRLVASLCSPFEGPDDFQVKLEIHPSNDWLEGLLDPADVKDTALYYAKGEMTGDLLDYHYKFMPLPGMRGKLRPRKVSSTGIKVVEKTKERGIQSIDLDEIEGGRGKKLSIGEIRFEFYIFDLDTSVLSLAMEDIKGFKTYLQENGGIRVYRDGVRVFDYGEPDNDWLNLDARRVNEPVGKVSNRQILGLVQLDGETSGALIEKSNREGFVENAAYETLKAALRFALTQVEAERRKDQREVRKFYSRRGANKPVLQEIAELRESLQEEGLLDEFEPQLKKIENQFTAFQETMLHAAAPGLTFGVIVHQVEKLMKELVIAVREESNIKHIRALVDQLDKLIDGIGDLFRRSGTAVEKASILIRQTIFNCLFRFKKHGISIVNGIEVGNKDFNVDCSRRLVVASLMNFIDNSIYWIQAAGRDEGKIYIGTTHDLDGGPCIVVADNGPGFQDDPESLVQPFFTRRDDGMGLGLYLADQAARRHVANSSHGRLVFPQKGDLALPKGFDGAIIAFQFPTPI